ncbi:MAG: di-trans,poly-cis-decaprenylcistransferase [Candidatus Omnitrophica bacterium CG1_02_49_16]|nr:MAG: di-trans,poly-cis-decaprenylcistransferase [Candidatus Omnitrophica bacterium CG1_02_49_16]
MNKTPKHVAIIMDGNGRWAQSRGLPRVAGHKAGMNTVRESVKTAIELGIPILTLYAFSQENWKRPKEEISVLMDLLDHFVDQEINNLIKEGVSVRTIGRIEVLPEHTLAKVRQATETTAHNEKLILNIALNYGARTEILDAVSKILKEAAINPSRFDASRALSEEEFSSRLYTAGLPDPDLLIRTSGEMRLSNFLLWQLSYSEIYITTKFWPDFHREDFIKAIAEYSKRERRFGDVGVPV